MKSPTAVGIQLIMFDAVTNAAIVLGGMEDKTATVEAEWNALSAVSGATSAFQAELLDADHDILEDRPISAETVVAKMGEPRDVLITQARKEERDIQTMWRVEATGIAASI